MQDWLERLAGAVVLAIELARDTQQVRLLYDGLDYDFAPGLRWLEDGGT